jgi:3',5'-cyclic AMP phosphodiesterase CpdA
MRFALLSDVHFGPPASFGGKLRKLTDQAEPLCRAIVARMNEVERPDHFVNLGDVIEDASRSTDEANYRRFLRVLESLDAPILHVAGNHDSINIPDADLAGLWGRNEPLYYYEQWGDVRAVVLRTIEGGGRITLPEEQLAWLEATLGESPTPALVFMHHPASEMDLRESRWFSNTANICLVAEREDFRRIIEASNKVLAVFNGHVHWNHFDVISRIPYITLQSVIENIDEDAPGRAAASYAVCELDRHRLLVRVLGSEPARYQIELGV